MKYYFPTQRELEIIKQHEKEIFVKIELLDKKFQVVESLEGNLVNDSFSLSANSRQRRAYNCDLAVTDSSFAIGSDKKIWIDKYIRTYYGIREQKTEEIYYWLIGTFTFIATSYSFSATSNTLSLQCADIMADYDGTKNGQLVGTHSIGEVETDERLKLNMSYTFKINAVAEYETDADGGIARDKDGAAIVKAYMKMRDAIIATLKLAGIPESRFYVEEYGEADQYLPYDLEFNVDSTFADIWDKLCEIYPNYEYFFDNKGMFVWQKIPTGYGDPIMMDNGLIEPLLISENMEGSFEGIYNATEVWGKNLELSLNDRYADNSVYDSQTNTYKIMLELIEGQKSDNEYDINTYFDHLDKIAFMASDTNSKDAPCLEITGTLDGKEYRFPALQIYDSGHDPVAIGKISGGHVYVFTFRRDYVNGAVANYMVLDGMTQCYGFYEESNPECPYSVTSLGYQIVQRISMETDYTDDVCYNRAERMTYESCAMKDTITLNMVTIPWLDMNQKIKYVSQNSPNREKELQINTPEYMVQDISWSSYEGSMTVNLYRFREDFEYVWDRAHAA